MSTSWLIGQSSLDKTLSQMLAVGLILIMWHFCLDPKVGLGPKHLVRLVSGLFQPTKLSKASGLARNLPVVLPGPSF